MIDHACHQMKNTSRNINLHSGVEKLDPNISIPETWAENSNCNIQSSQSKQINILYHIIDIIFFALFRLHNYIISTLCTFIPNLDLKNPIW